MAGAWLVSQWRNLPNPGLQYQHELGGAKVFYVNQDMWQGA